MPRDRPLPGGRLEYAVLVAAWEGGALTVRDQHDRVGVPLGLVYTTTARVLDRLHDKKLVTRVKAGHRRLTLGVLTTCVVFDYDRCRI